MIHLKSCNDKRSRLRNAKISIYINDTANHVTECSSSQQSLTADPPENCHFTVKKLPKTCHFFQKNCQKLSFSNKFQLCSQQFHQVYSPRKVVLRDLKKTRVTGLYQVLCLTLQLVVITRRRRRNPHQAHRNQRSRSNLTTRLMTTRRL